MSSTGYLTISLLSLLLGVGYLLSEINLQKPFARKVVILLAIPFLSSLGLAFLRTSRSFNYAALVTLTCLSLIYVIPKLNDLSNMRRAILAIVYVSALLLCEILGFHLHNN